MPTIPPRILYPGIVIGILLMSVTAHVILIVLASRDGGAQVVDDYYEKATHWDAEQAENARALRHVAPR